MSGSSQSTQVKKIDVFAINKYVFALYKKYFWAIVIVGIVDTIPQVENYFLSSADPTDRVQFPLEFVLANVLGILITAVTTSTLLWFLDHREHGKKLTLWLAFKQASPYILLIFLASIFVSIISIIGLLFLIVPGIILSIMFSQVVPFMILKKQKIKEAVSSSISLTKGNRWALFRAYGQIWVLGIMLFVLTEPLHSQFANMFVVISYIESIFLGTLGILVTYAIWHFLHSEHHKDVS